MTTAAFLASLRDRQINLSVEGDRLRCTAPKGALTQELQAEIARLEEVRRSVKAELVRYEAVSTDLVPVRVRRRGR